MGPLQAAHSDPSIPADKHFNDVVNALAAFTLCKDDPKFQAEAFKKVTTFDMSGLDDVIEQYERELAHCTQRGNEARETIMNWIKPDSHTSISTSTMTALGRHPLVLMRKDKAFASAMASVDKVIWSHHAMNTTLILDVIRSIQLFVVEKKWGFVDEAFKVINYDLPVDAQTPPPPAFPLSFREILDSPECLIGLLEASDKMLKKLSKEEVLKERKFREKMPEENISNSNQHVPKRKARAKPSKEKRSDRKGKENVEESEEESRLTTPLDQLFAQANARHDKAIVALGKYQTNLKEGIAMIRAYNASISTERYKPPPLPESMEYRGITITSKPPGLPRALRQDLFDLQFVGERIQRLVPIVDDVGARAMATIRYWSSAGKECWDYVKEHLYEMAKLREYEYYRRDQIASYVLANNLQRKVVRWFSKNGSNKFTSDLVNALNFNRQTGAQFRPDRRGDEEEEVVVVLISVDELMVSIDTQTRAPRIPWSQYLV